MNEQGKEENRRIAVSTHCLSCLVRSARLLMLIVIVVVVLAVVVALLLLLSLLSHLVDRCCCCCVEVGTGVVGRFVMRSEE
jgi:hypothetical protein